MRLHFCYQKRMKRASKSRRSLRTGRVGSVSEILPRDWAAELAQLTPALKSRLRLSALC
jgi:hypothetical protein